MPGAEFATAFAALLREDPQAPVVFGPERIATRADLHAQAGFLARALAPLAPGSVVALVAENGAGFLAGLLAAAQTGHAVLLVDPTLPQAGTRRLAETFAVSAFLHPDDPQPVTGTQRRSAGLPPGSLLKLTSGSTGRPRGVLAHAAAVLDDVMRLAHTMRITGSDRLLAAVPMSYSYGLSSLAGSALALGTALVVPRAGSPFNLLVAGARHAATVLPTTPTFLQGLLAHRSARLPDSLRLVISAGAPLAAEHAARFRQRYRQPVHVFYGASECGGICYDREGGAAERGTLGTPVDGVEVALGHDGRIAVRSPAVATSYWPEASPGLAAGRFSSSDLGAFDGGELRLFGRADDVVHVAGRKVHPREIEAVLLECSGVEDAVVLAEPDPLRGARWRAFVAGAAELGSAAVMAFCRDRLAPHMQPATVAVLPRIPRTVRGKVDRARLADVATPAPR